MGQSRVVVRFITGSWFTFFCFPNERFVRSRIVFNKMKVQVLAGQNHYCTTWPKTAMAIITNNLTTKFYPKT